MHLDCVFYYLSCRQKEGNARTKCIFYSLIYENQKGGERGCLVRSAKKGLFLETFCRKVASEIFKNIILDRGQTLKNPLTSNEREDSYQYYCLDSDLFLFLSDYAINSGSH